MFVKVRLLDLTARARVVEAENTNYSLTVQLPHYCFSIARVIVALFSHKIGIFCILSRNFLSVFLNIFKKNKKFVNASCWLCCQKSRVWLLASFVSFQMFIPVVFEPSIVKIALSLEASVLVLPQMTMQQK